MMHPCNRPATWLVTGMLLASTPVLAVDTAVAAEAALAEAEVAIAQARVNEALWTTAWNALQEARRARIKQDYAASLRWSARAEELAGLGLTQAGREVEPSPAGGASTTGATR